MVATAFWLRLSSAMQFRYAATPLWLGFAWLSLLVACCGGLQVQQPDEAQIARENWLAVHLKEEFEMKK
eukprot:3358505-Amphidinium_carterae.1